MKLAATLALVSAMLLPNVTLAAEGDEYEPTPENLAARREFQDDRFGVFIHWGVYSVLGRGEWVMNNEEMTVEEYEPLTERFNPVEFDADQWCKLFKDAGANYVTITSKHHDGFCMWDSELTDWDIVDRTPYGKDVLKQLADACERHGLKLYFYYSQVDWHHPDYYPRGKTGRTAGRPDEGDWDEYLAYMNGQLAELLGGEYGKIGGIWFDGWWDQQAKRFEDHEDADPKVTLQDWRLRETYDLIHREQPAALIGSNHHVAPFPGEDFQMFERDLPGQNTSGHSDDAVVGALPLETCDTINRSWGYNAEDNRYKSVPQLVQYLVKAVGNDANFLLNVGPRPDGTIDPESAKRLRGVGEWLEENGQTIYGARGGPVAPQSWGVTTRDEESVYIHVLDAGAADGRGWLTLSGTSGLDVQTLKRLDSGEPVEMRRTDQGELSVRVHDPHPIDTILTAPLQ